MSVSFEEPWEVAGELSNATIAIEANSVLMVSSFLVSTCISSGQLDCKNRALLTTAMWHDPSFEGYPEIAVGTPRTSILQRVWDSGSTPSSGLIAPSNANSMTTAIRRCPVRGIS